MLLFPVCSCCLYNLLCMYVVTVVPDTTKDVREKMLDCDLSVTLDEIWNSEEARSNMLILLSLLCVNCIATYCNCMQ